MLEMFGTSSDSVNISSHSCNEGCLELQSSRSAMYGNNIERYLHRGLVKEGVRSCGENPPDRPDRSLTTTLLKLNEESPVSTIRR